MWLFSLEPPRRRECCSLYIPSKDTQSKQVAKGEDHSITHSFLKVLAYVFNVTGLIVYGMIKFSLNGGIAVASTPFSELTFSAKYLFSLPLSDWANCYINQMSPYKYIQG